MILKFIVMGLWNIIKAIGKLIHYIFTNYFVIAYGVMGWYGFYLIMNDKPISNTYLFFMLVIAVAMLNEDKKK